MSDETALDSEDAPKKGGKLGLILGLVLAMGLGGGAFYAVYSGMILGDQKPETVASDSKDSQIDSVAFIPIDPIVISVGRGAEYTLRFRAQLEVNPLKTEEVVHLMPRILDVLNGYLRAVDIEDLRDPAALLRIRAHMLRRVKLVAGEDSVSDLLISEFVFT